MKDPATLAPQVPASIHALRFQVGQRVEVNRGPLAGLSGVLIGLRSGHRCLIELDVTPRGVVLLIDSAAVTKRPTANLAEFRPRRMPDG
jgi:transcription antitermination factor NusG